MQENTAFPGKQSDNLLPYLRNVGLLTDQSLDDSTLAALNRTRQSGIAVTAGTRSVSAKRPQNTTRHQTIESNIKAAQEKVSLADLRHVGLLTDQSLNARDVTCHRSNHQRRRSVSASSRISARPITKPVTASSNGVPSLQTTKNEKSECNKSIHPAQL